jgi:predicted dehydrogenase
VLSEKPITANAAEARALQAVAAEAPGRIVEGFHYLHHPAVQRLREIVTSGELGELREVVITFTLPAPPDGDPRWSLPLAGGATMDIGCYVLSAARHLGRWIGGAPRLVSAIAEEHAPGVDARMSVLVEYPGGLPGRLRWDMAAADRSMVWTVVGTAGSVTLPSFAVPQMDPRVLVDLPAGPREETHGDLTSYTCQLAAVADSLRTGSPFPVDLDDAVANMELIDACYLAAGMRPRGS